MPRSTCIKTSQPTTNSRIITSPSNARRRVSRGFESPSLCGTSGPSGSIGDHLSGFLIDGIVTDRLALASLPPLTLLKRNNQYLPYGTPECAGRNSGFPQGMAPKVNRLAPEARCLPVPSRRLNRDILWRSAYRGWARGALYSAFEGDG